MFDVITHSRGGLLARALTELSDTNISALLGREWNRPVGVQVNFEKVIFVGTPNNGTYLATPTNIPTFIDHAATITSILPDSFGTLALGGLMAVASSVAQVGIPKLPGLVDQSPDSELLKRLNATKPVTAGSYYAIRADYSGAGKVIGTISAEVMNTLFNDEANDLVVPTAGVSDNPAFGLLNDRVRTYANLDAVHHTNYFFKAETWAQILNFLGI